jgi:hypothetical protein
MSDALCKDSVRREFVVIAWSVDPVARHLNSAGKAHPNISEPSNWNEY